MSEQLQNSEFRVGNTCSVCGRKFFTDKNGRRESDWLICNIYCDSVCNLSAMDIADGRSISDVLMMTDDPEYAFRRVRNVFDMAEFCSALRVAAMKEVRRLNGDQP